jgi:chromate reductase
MKNLLFIAGSLRAASASKATMRSLQERLGAIAHCRTAEIGHLPLYNADLSDDPGVAACVAAFVASVQAADGVVFVTPEYNYSVPGMLKNAIDWASRPALDSVFKGKPCFVISVSGGALGCVRAQAHLKYILNGMLAEVYVCKEIVVTMANTKVTDGRLTDTVVLDFATENLTNFVAAL